MHVELRKVSRSFGKVTALAAVDLELASGSRTALIGPNGSGKSTLTRALLGLIHYRGEILLDGRPRVADDPDANARIAYVPQVTPRLAATVGELVDTFCALRGTPRRRVEELAAAFGVPFEEVAGRPLRELSGGMRQKTLAALALATAAPLLVLDEPTASMDPASRRTFFTAVEALPRTSTVVLCSHRLDEIRSLVDRVAVLDEGRLQFAGAADRFLRERSTSLIEVRARDAAADVLRGLGFTRGATGWWTRAVPATERATVVRQVVGAVGDGVIDLLATDLEDLHLRPLPRPETARVS